MDEDRPAQGTAVSAHQRGPRGRPGSDRPRWVINLRVLLGILASMILSPFVVPWHLVYGSWSRESDMGALLFPVIGLGIGLGVWLLAWTVTFLGPRAVWITILVVSLLAPALVVNVLAFRDARERVCEIRSQGRDDRLNDVPWPLALDCAYGPGVTKCGGTTGCFHYGAPDAVTRSDGAPEPLSTRKVAPDPLDP